MNEGTMVATRVEGRQAESSLDGDVNTLIGEIRLEEKARAEALFADTAEKGIASVLGKWMSVKEALEAITNGNCE